jgi:choline monooxygenase
VDARHALWLTRRMPSRLPPFEKDLARASTLPAFAYTDAAILAAERETIFARTWQPVGHAEDVAAPGTYLTAEIDGKPLVVTRDASGELRGFYNVCRHRAGPVAIGKGSRRSLTCKYHGWTYGLDGGLVTTPELGEVKDFDKSCIGLVPVRVESWGPFVFACLDAKAPPLASVLGKIPEETEQRRLGDMRFVARKDYVIQANWKTYVDNFLEGYHLPTVHPGLFKVLDYGAYEVKTERFYSKQVSPLRGTTGTATEGEALYYWVFPNWMLNIYPDNMSLNLVLPLAADRCVTIFEWYRHDANAKDDIEKTIAFSDGIQEEDIMICEAVQRGLASGSYERGRFSTLRENGVHHFQSLVHEHLTRDRFSPR